jgi:hypothetical protein
MLNKVRGLRFRDLLRLLSSSLTNCRYQVWHCMECLGNVRSSIYFAVLLTFFGFLHTVYEFYTIYNFIFYLQDVHNDLNQRLSKCYPWCSMKCLDPMEEELGKCAVSPTRSVSSARDVTRICLIVDNLYVMP